MYFDRFDICEAYCVLEWDYNEGGWLHERATNRRKMQATSIQLGRIQFKPKPDLSFFTLTENGMEIYLNQIEKLKLPFDDDGEEMTHYRLITSYDNEYNYKY